MEKKKQIPNTLMSSWQKRDIKEFIQALELPEEIYETLKKKKIVSGVLFVKQTDLSLQKIGVINNFFRRKIMKYINEFNELGKSHMLHKESQIKQPPEEEKSFPHSSENIEDDDEECMTLHKQNKNKKNKIIEEDEDSDEENQATMTMKRKKNEIPEEKKFQHKTSNLPKSSINAINQFPQAEIFFSHKYFDNFPNENKKNIKNQPFPYQSRKPVPLHQSENQMQFHPPKNQMPFNHHSQIQMPVELERNKKLQHKITIQILNKKKEKELFYFYEDFTIGRSEANVLSLPTNSNLGIYPDISDFHCQAKLNTQGIFELEDCGSEFGTFYRLNAYQKYAVETGQIYGIGKTLIKIENILEKNLEFEVIEGSIKGELVEIGKQKEFNIGAASKNNYIIKGDKWVSELHCVFKRKKNGGFSIIDNDSTNGVWKKINEGDKLQLIPEVNVKLGSKTVIYVLDAV